MIFQEQINSSLGNILIKATDSAIISVKFVEPADSVFSNHITNLAKQQLLEYIAKKRKKFTIPLLFSGTEFQNKVWQELAKIPYNMKFSYKDISQRVDNINATRAVGGAIAKNPILIIIPCHRVINSNNKIGGYQAGVKIKEWLLEHESENK